MHYRAIAPGVLLGLALGLGATSAAAEGLPVRDGLWETTVKSPLTGERTSRECLKGTVLDPQSMLEGQSKCRMTEHVLQGNTLTFTMTCAGGSDSGSAQGRMSVDGDRGAGEMNLQFNTGDREMSMTLTWDAVRVGDC